MLRLFTIIAIFAFSVSSSYAKECYGLVVARDSSHPFWNEVIKGAKAASNELNIDLRFRGSVDEERQKLIIEHMVNISRCSGLIIAPAGDSINESVKELNAEGMAVTYIDRDTGGERDAIVKSDNYYGGVLAAQVMAKRLKERKNVVLLRMKKGISSTDDREAGFLAEAKKLGFNIILDTYLGVTKGDGRNPAKTVFSNVKDIDGIFTPTGSTTEIVIRTLEQLNYPGRPIHIGFDGSDYLDQKIRDGNLYGYVKQDPFNIGYYGVYTEFKIINKQEYMKDLKIPIIFVSNGNLE